MELEKLTNEQLLDKGWRLWTDEGHDTRAEILRRMSQQAAPQPIETVPEKFLKDGKRIWIFTKMTVWHRDGWHIGTFIEREGCSSWWADLQGCGFMRPTHWAPINPPPPPQEDLS